MSSEKNLEEQQKAFRELLRNTIYLATSNPFKDKEHLQITLQAIPGMNKENIKPYLKDVLGYTPEIELYRETYTDIDETHRVSAAFLILKLK